MGRRGSPRARGGRGATGTVDGWGEMFHSRHPTPSPWSPSVPSAPSPGSCRAAPPRPAILTRGLQLQDRAWGSSRRGEAEQQPSVAQRGASPSVPPSSITSRRGPWGEREKGRWEMRLRWGEAR